MTASSAPRHVVVLGLMGGGKSSVGRALAARLGRPLRDNDQELARVIGTTASQHAAVHGLADLHRIEADVLRSCLAEPEPSVVTSAASVGDREDLRELVGDHFVVWLDVDPQVLADRMTGPAGHRPVRPNLLAQLREQHQRRGPIFRGVADVVVTWRGETPDELAERIVERLGPTGAGPG